MFRFCILIWFSVGLWAQYPEKNLPFEATLEASKSGFGLTEKSARIQVAVGLEVLFGTDDPENIEEMYLATKRILRKADEAKIGVPIPKMDREYKKDKEKMRQDPFLNEVLAANSMLQSIHDENPPPLHKRKMLADLLQFFPIHPPLGWAIIENELALGNVEGARRMFQTHQTWFPTHVLWPSLVLDARILREEGKITVAFERLHEAARFYFSKNNPAMDLTKKWQGEISDNANNAEFLAKVGAIEKLKDLSKKDTNALPYLVDYYGRQRDPKLNAALKKALKVPEAVEPTFQVLLENMAYSAFTPGTVRIQQKFVEKGLKKDIFGAKKDFYLALFSSEKSDVKVPALKRWLAENPDDMMALRRGLSFLSLSDEDHRPFLREFAKKSSDPMAWAVLIGYLHLKGEIDLMTQAWYEAIEAYPADPTVTSYLANKNLPEQMVDSNRELLTYFCLKTAEKFVTEFNYPKAATFAKKAAEYTPDRPEIGLYYATILWRDRPGEDTLNALLEVESAFGAQPFYWEMVGDSYFSQSLLRKSIKSYKQGLEISPERESLKKKLEFAKIELDKKAAQAVLAVVAVAAGAASGSLPGQNHNYIGGWSMGNGNWHVTVGFEPTSKLKDSYLARVEGENLPHGLPEALDVLSDLFVEMETMDQQYQTRGYKSFLNR